MLCDGGTARAASYIVKKKQPMYKKVFDNLNAPFAEVARKLGDISWSKQYGPYVEYDSPGGAVIFQLEKRTTSGV